MENFKSFLSMWLLLATIVGGIRACANLGSNNSKKTASQPTQATTSPDQNSSQEADAEQNIRMQQEAARFDMAQRSLENFLRSQDEARRRVLQDAMNFRYDKPSSPSDIKGHILIFGGHNRQIFLGCITCGEHEDVSIHNSVGNYGSSVAANSIFNQVGNYGSRVSDYSVCNPRAQNPPVVVDQQGNFYGYLNVNLEQYPVAFPQLAALIQGVCQ